MSPSTSSLNSRDPFGKLPVKLRLAIITFLPDLPTLYHLTCASKVSRDTFEDNPVRTTSAIIRSLITELRQIIRAVTIGLPSVPTDIPLIDGDLFMDSKNERTGLQRETDEESRYLLPSTLTLSPVRSLLQLSCRIQVIGASFLKIHIHRINSIAIEHLRDDRHPFRRDRAFDDYPQGITYTPQKTDAISWVEDYRVERALWRLQLLAMFTPGRTEVTQIDCTPYKTGTPREQDFARIYCALTDWELDEMQCVQDYMNECRISLQGTAPADLERGPLLSQKTTVPTSPSGTMQRPMLSDPPTNTMAHAWYQDHSAAQRPTQSYRMFKLYASRAPHSPLQGVDWKIFRRLGFGIWDLKRMGAMELYSVQNRQDSCNEEERLRFGTGIVLKPNNTLFTWRSIKVDGKRIVTNGP